MKSLLVILLLSVSALAQPVVGPEMTSTPIEKLDDYALAPQRDGFVLAWTAAGRMHAAHLDASLHPTAPALELPFVDPAAAAVMPAIASNGTSVLVAWHEQRLGYAESTFIALLTPDARTILQGPLTINYATDAPLLVSAKGKYVLYTGDLRYVLDESLNPNASEFISRHLGGALTESGEVATVNESAKGSFDCHYHCPAWCPVPLPDCHATSTVTFALGSQQTSAQYDFTIGYNSSMTDPFLTRPPVIGPNGASYAGVAQYQSRSDFFAESVFTLPLAPVGEIALAGNGEDVLVVWTVPSLTGAIVHADRTASSSFAIAPAGVGPKVVNINSTSFAVLYRVEVDPDHSSIAGRIVRLQETRKRATR